MHLLVLTRKLRSPQEPEHFDHNDQSVQNLKMATDKHNLFSS